MSVSLLDPPEQVLSTLNADGSRRWLRPRVSRGRFLTARRIMAYGLIALFTLLPHIRINGRPAMLLDIVHRKFHLFGVTFLPTDTLLLALFMLCVFVAIFLFTSVCGRVWCGWACPQTVYMEFLYRPIERLVERTVGRGGPPGRPVSGIRQIVKILLYLAASVFLAHTFLAYFVGVEALAQWVRRSPLEHPTSFLVMLVTTALMMFNFTWFREQTCVLACPYGRFQSVLLDRNSLIISYDARRGEPRGKLRAAGRELPVLAPAPAAPRGDCIDCHLCVTTCPTGIDIRNGLQMECVGCTQCIDACDAVMTRIGRPKGLIRYTSQARLSGERARIFRGRVFYYGAILALLGTLFIYFLVNRAAADLALLRGPGLPFFELASGEVSNQFRLKITNRTDQPETYEVAVASGAAARVASDEFPAAVGPGETRVCNLLVVAPRDAFVDGHAEITLDVRGAHGFGQRVRQKLLGPTGPPRSHP
jgi:cytochrome c oxidase accessory protein FixG